MRRVLFALLVVAPACGPEPAPFAPIATTARPIPASARAEAPQAAKPPVALRDPAPPAADAWATIDPEAAGLDRDALARILERAEQTETSALIVLRNGKLLVERYFGQTPRPIETMSMTKSLVSIAIGILIDDGKIPSVDEPLSRYYPTFRRGKKAKITLRHVLTHSTGLAHGRGAGELNAQKNRLAYALGRDVEKEPGVSFSYNNEATQLLSGIVEKAAGVPLDAFMKERVFEPLGITSWRWARDDAGNVQTFYGAALSARDLAKIGLMMLGEGRYADRRIVSAAWVKASTSPQEPSEEHGYLWWMRYRTARATLASQGVQPFQIEPAARFGFAADGWLGQQLIVYPSIGLVVVRQHEAPAGVIADDAYNQRVGYFSLGREIELALKD